MTKPDFNQSSLTKLPRRSVSRRSILTVAGALSVIGSSFGSFGAARALTGGPMPKMPDDAVICRAAATQELTGPPRQLKLAWNANSVCTVAALVAKDRGVFAEHHVVVELFNLEGTTDQ